ncbi:pyrroline-5-carboxylate reductase [Mobilicoccus caccae]|uniref:Pyrroline-5-carboxylate reductase n=1 Tax=Mobilicoccus caccae TaxID=1859295 RepID=A0ABQ6IMK4_9MICO|nr:pyrroline-5-carboxylate reductase [Mobilicoccus caccae]GMA38428.1 pyrroline-5-carboxylate reductase [Mobilicoccus caccae]
MTSDTPDLSTFEARIAVLGAGMMGGAVLSGLLAADLSAESVIVTNIDEDALRPWAERGVQTSDDNVAATRDADIVFLAVKPHVAADLLDEIAAELSEDTLVVSLAAGVTLSTLEGHAGAGVPVVRVMPNTPALVGEGMFVLTPGEHCGKDRLEAVEQLLNACGRTEVVPERLQDAATGLSGSGPAYLFYVADALIEGGVLEGLPRPMATRLVAQTLFGSAAMVRQGDEPPATLREQVTSPGGSTAAALRVLDAGAVRHHLGAAVSASTKRSAELGA